MPARRNRQCKCSGYARLIMSIIYQSIVDLIGEHEALILTQAFGGQSVSFNSHKAKPVQLSAESWSRLCAYFGTEQVHVPIKPTRINRDAEIVSKRRKGFGINQLAAEFRLSSRQVIRICVQYK